MGDDLLHAERKSVIRFGGRTYDYPLNLPNLLKTAPLALMAGAVKDLLLLPFSKKPDDFAKASFAEWIQSHFGRTLYRQFFEGYTGKLWGINPDKLSADWAGQRISLIDLKDVARRLLPRRNGSISVRTYARKYRYPKYGFGQIFTTLGERLVAEGVELKTGATITRLEQADGRIERVYWKQDDVEQSERFDQVISTLPLPLTCQHLGLPCDLQYRSLRFVNMPLKTGKPVGQHLAVPLRPPYSGHPSAGAAPPQPLYGAPGPDLGDAGDPLQSGGCHLAGSAF